MFKARHHQQSERNAVRIAGGKLLVGALLCAALIGVVLAPGAAAQTSTQTPTQPVGIDWSVQWNGTTVNANDVIQVNPTPVYILPAVDQGFDTPGLLPQTIDQTGTQGYNGYTGMDSAYQPQGSMQTQDAGGIYNGQVTGGTNSGGVMWENGQSIGADGNTTGGPSGNPLTKEQYNMGAPPTRPSGTLVESGSISSQNTDSGGAGTVPIQTIAPY